jgi:hypothetical protein
MALPKLLKTDTRAEPKRSVKIASEVIRGNFIHEVGDRFCGTFAAYLIIAQASSKRGGQRYCGGSIGLRVHCRPMGLMELIVFVPPGR